MPKAIRLESIVEVALPHPHAIKQMEGRLNIRFCPTCGERLTKEVAMVEYACSICNHLIDIEESYCSFCGAKLDCDTPIIEHYCKGEKVSNAKFKLLVKEL